MNGRDPTPPFATHLLTEREYEVLRCLGNGLSNRQIAAQMTVALSTVKWYVNQIYSKLAVSNREEAVARGRSLGLLAPSASPPHNLPQPPTSFIGRELELTALAQYLADPTVRLITILGPGGIGKTRLALAAAEGQLNSRQQPHPFTYGIYFASLAHQSTADLLLPAIAAAVNFRFSAGDEPEAQLLRYLRSKGMLLLLDNFEHLRAGVGLLDKMVQTAPAVKLLVTSRERLNLQAEYLFPIGAMALPEDDAARDRDSPLELIDYSAIQLFCQSARRMQPDFALTADNQLQVLAICRLVGGMPLGVILAAGWLSLLTPPEILAEMSRNLDFLATEMGDVPERQRSLRAAFNHSWRLLSQRERDVFAQLSVFRDGFRREEAQVVAGAPLHDLQALVNKSLLYRAPTGRYEIHELLRQFAAEQLAQLPEVETAVRDRHSAYFCAFLQEWTRDWHTDRQIDARHAVAQAAGNIRQAWDWALTQREWLRLAQAIDSWGWYHQWHGRLKEFVSLCQAIIDRTESRTVAEVAGTDLDEVTVLPDCLRLRAKALTWLGWSVRNSKVASDSVQQALALLERPELAGQDTRLEKALAITGAHYLVDPDDLQMAQERFAQCLALFEELGYQWGVALAFRGMGLLEWNMGNYDAVNVESMETALAIHQDLGDRSGMADCQSVLGVIYRSLGNLDQAEQLHRQALDLNQQLGDQSAIVARKAQLAYTLSWQGKFEEAQYLAEESVASSHELDDPLDEVWSRIVLGVIFLHTGRYHLARRQADHALLLLQEPRARPLDRASLHLLLGHLALVKSSYIQAQAAFAQSRENFEQSRPGLTGFALAGLGQAACNLGNLAQARQYLVQALAASLAHKAYMPAVYALSFAALFLATTGHVEWGVEVWEVARRQPLVARSRWFADVVGREVETWAADLPPEVAEAARERGRALALWATAEALLAELS
jgi:predicted ATPase/DNA-binding CsgD family transcriptional regulator